MEWKRGKWIVGFEEEGGGCKSATRLSCLRVRYPATPSPRVKQSKASSNEDEDETKQKKPNAKKKSHYIEKGYKLSS